MKLWLTAVAVIMLFQKLLMKVEGAAVAAFLLSVGPSDVAAVAAC